MKNKTLHIFRKHSRVMQMEGSQEGFMGNKGRKPRPSGPGGGTMPLNFTGYGTDSQNAADEDLDLVPLGQQLPKYVVREMRIIKGLPSCVLHLTSMLTSDSDVVFL